MGHRDFGQPGVYAAADSSLLLSEGHRAGQHGHHHRQPDLLSGDAPAGGEHRAGRADHPDLPEQDPQELPRHPGNHGFGGHLRGEYQGRRNEIPERFRAVTGRNRGEVHLVQDIQPLQRGGQTGGAGQRRDFLRAGHGSAECNPAPGLRRAGRGDPAVSAERGIGILCQCPGPGPGRNLRQRHQGVRHCVPAGHEPGGGRNRGAEHLAQAL